MKTDSPRPYGDTREPEEERRAKVFRFPVSASERLAAAAQKYGVTETYYLLLALENQFQKDQIT